MKITKSEYEGIIRELTMSVVKRTSVDGLEPDSGMVLAMTYMLAYADLGRKLFKEDATELEIMEE